MTCDYQEQFATDGYAVVRGLFDPHDVRLLSEAFDRVYSIAARHPASFRHKNVFFQQCRDPLMGRIVRLVQWPSYFDDVLARFRTHPRMLGVLEPLLGPDLKQIINQLHWKPPGAARVEFGYHQDIRSRRPREAYRDPEASYVQTGIAVDPHERANGAMTVVPGSHRCGELDFDATSRVMNRCLTDDDLTRVGIDPAAKVDLDLAPGDLAIWHLNLVHGSGVNTTRGDRRFYINGYVVADNCDRGEWAFRDGRPCELGEPALVHYEDLYERPEPHYVD